MRLHVVALGLGAMIAAGALTSSADATLCLSRSDKMKHRDSCKPKETPVDMSNKDEVGRVPLERGRKAAAVRGNRQRMLRRHRLQRSRAREVRQPQSQ